MGGVFKSYGKAIDKSLGLATAIPRSLDILPEEAKTVQGSIDLARGKVKPSGGGSIGKAIDFFGKKVKGPS